LGLSPAVVGFWGQGKRHARLNLLVTSKLSRLTHMVNSSVKRTADEFGNEKGRLANKPAFLYQTMRS
jgi:hypothetical protein